MGSDRGRRVIVEGTTAEHARGGIGVVVAGLMSALAEDEDRRVTVWLGPTTGAPDNVDVRPIGPTASSGGRMVVQRALLPLLPDIRDRNARVLFMDSYLPFWDTAGLAERATVFVHDVLPLTHPELFARPRDFFKRLAYRSIARARPDTVTSCEYTATEAEHVFGIRPRVAALGCGQLTDAEAESFRTAADGEREAFVLYVGNLDRRKGLATLVRAVQTAASRSSQEIVLAIVGNWRSPDGLALRRSLRSWPDAPVRFLGRRPKGELLALMRRARALIYPAEAEGFGLPVLEGLATSTPVIASDLDVIRSWALDTVSYAAPGDVAAFADAIAEAESEATGERVRRGLELTESYRWSRFARELLTPLLD